MGVTSHHIEEYGKPLDDVLTLGLVGGGEGVAISGLGKVLLVLDAYILASIGNLAVTYQGQERRKEAEEL